MSARRVDVRIDELVLEDVRPAEAADVGAALERELARLVREGGVAASAQRIETAPAAQIERVPGEPAAVLGARVAGAIYGRVRG